MEPWLAAHLPVLDLALDAVRAVQRASARACRPADGIDPARPDPPDPEPARLAAAFASDRVFALGGRAVDGFAPLSGFFRTADGWVRTHANYPHHRERLTALVDLPDDVARPVLAQRLTELPGQELEDLAADIGAIVARVRTEQEWRASEPGRAAASGPLVRTGPRPAPAADAPRTGSPARRPLAIDAAHGGTAPLAGIRVLDLTRVIAGPVATRTLALLGADVLRVDPPDPAEIEWQHLDTGQGKRSTVLDLRDARDRRTAQDLLDAADVLVTGYRPGAIDPLGLEVPHDVVTGRVSAWGASGPWADRRGFDSIVQAASGIALLEGQDGTPGALPAQALDHASGYLLAAGIVDALTRRGDGPGHDVSVSLARTATWLLDLPGRDPQHPAAAPAPGNETVTHDRVTTARPALPGHDDYPHPAHPWGRDAPSWLAGRPG
ncbi:CoA transferase [Promicromonospora iranensis]|uniref:Crotonobetainyl-CoA:carnitine CoA-transferase CaiB-like acyl-CoA transferase n=1 Tax=Promicromonospora iranensis TaxID=1105144 RepID=A0ABU2CP20_9MICO|nr:CoA transferase [Promicromonospora iranensis]MDR7383093.1 crotonobetainyl-CoA:carnitine CoA-transferase CaiB-like acyl-CoA transferase [Promicromonospora iranensis]